MVRSTCRRAGTGRRRTGDAGRGSGRREYFDMERGAGGGAGERALEQVFKQRVSGDACLNRGSGGANPGTRARTRGVWGATGSTWRLSPTLCVGSDRRASRLERGRHGQTWAPSVAERELSARVRAPHASTTRRRAGKATRCRSHRSSTPRGTCSRRSLSTGGWRTCSGRVSTWRLARPSCTVRSLACALTVRGSLRRTLSCTWTRSCVGQQRSCVLDAAWARAVGGGDWMLSGVQSEDGVAQATSSLCRALTSHVERIFPRASGQRSWTVLQEPFVAFPTTGRHPPSAHGLTVELVHLRSFSRSSMDTRRFVPTL